jgi:ComF family protein
MRSAYIYKDSVRKLILKFKYSDRMFLAGELAEGMIAVIRNNSFFDETDMVVAVPLSILRRIKRGYNQAQLLACELSKKISKPLVKNILIRKKITKPQFNLSKRERFENIKGSFGVRNKDLIKNKNIMLVDDIATTSATASACAKALKEAGCKKVYVITLARD